MILIVSFYFHSGLINNKSKSQEEITSVNLVISDSFEERINCKVYLNGSLQGNEISSEYFLPFIGNFGMIIAGIGKMVLIKNLKCHFSEKNPTENDKKHCDCCNIF